MPHLTTTILIDGSGFRWDIPDRLGSITDGSRDAFDGGFRLTGFFISGSTTDELGGRQKVIGPLNDGTFDITRSIYVPDDVGSGCHWGKLRSSANCSPRPSP